MLISKVALPKIGMENSAFYLVFQTDHKKSHLGQIFQM